MSKMHCIIVITLFYDMYNLNASIKKEHKEVIDIAHQDVTWFERETNLNNGGD